MTTAYETVQVPEHADIFEKHRKDRLELNKLLTWFIEKHEVKK